MYDREIFETSCKYLNIQGVPKKTLFLGFLAITPLWKGLEIKVGVFQKLQEILNVIGTEIFQIDLLEAEKIGSKDGNSN